MLEKKYLRAVVKIPADENNRAKVIKERWHEIDVNNPRESRFLTVLQQALTLEPGTQEYIQIRDNRGNIHIIPSDVLRQSIIRIEYSAFGV